MNKIKRILTAAIVGCVIMFIWGAVSHMVLFIGSGFTPLPNEDEIIKTMEKSVHKEGLYLFPGKNFSQKSSPEQESAFNEKFQHGPVGILVYRPVGGNPLSPAKLLTQLASNFLAALIAAFIVSLLIASYWKRVFVITLLGALACVSVSVIYWNWYQFPNAFFFAQIADQVACFFLAGLAIAKIVLQPEYIVRD